MFFTSRDTREQKLEEIKLNPRQVPYGAAIEHAETTQLGLWADRGMLERDCAEIMLAEIRKFCLDTRPKTARERENPVSIPGQSRRRLDLEERVEIDERAFYVIDRAVAMLTSWQIQHTRAFGLAFRKAQSGPENQLADALTSLGVKNHNAHVHLSEEEQQMSLHEVHIAIIKELIGWPSHLEITTAR